MGHRNGIRTYVRALKKCVANAEVEVVVDTAFYEGDDIHGFEDVENDAFWSTISSEPF